MRRFHPRRQAVLVAMLALAAPFACTPSFDATRTPLPEATVGTKLYGVVCDRMSAQSLTEDLTGASFTAVCHPTAAGVFANSVDESQLPPVQATTTASGEAVSLATAQATRTHALARVNTLAKDRAKLIAAFDATIPKIEIALKDTTNAHPSNPCAAAAGNAKDALSSQLSDMLGRFGPLYADGTVPRSTEAMSRVFDAFHDSDAALSAYARFDAREGYRPLSVALGAIRPVLAYDDLRALTNETLTLISSNADPFATTATPGAAYPAFTTLLDATYQELRTATGDGVVLPLVLSETDPVGRAVLSRPRTDLEFMEQLFYAENSAFGTGGASAYIAKRDPRGYVELNAPSGSVPAPFVNENGLPKIDELGQFVTSDGKPAPSPFLAPEGTSAPAYDTFSRAIPAVGGDLYYNYIDTSHTYAASLLHDLQGLLPTSTDTTEAMMDALAGTYVLAGPRSAKATSTKQYPADATASTTWSLTHQGTPPSGLDTTPVTLEYSGFDASSSAMLDLVYGMMQAVPGPTNDDLLAYTNALLATDTSNVARLVGDGLAMKANANAATTAHIPATSTFWDEMIDVTIQIEQEPGLLEDILTALGDDRTPGLATAFSNYNKFNDKISYDRSNLNGPAFNVTTGTSTPMHTPVDRSKPDTGYNRSAFQRFLQIVHDTDGVTVCNKEGATVDAKVSLLGVNVSVTMPKDDPCDQNSVLGGGDGTYPECSVYKISNAAAFYLDSIIGKASMYLRDDELRDGIGTDGTFCPDLGLEAATVGLMTLSSGITGTDSLWSPFWDASDSQTLRPTPQFLDRQMFFDLANDSPGGAGTNAQTNTFLTDLDGMNIGTSVCPERIIEDPDPDAPDASSDGLVHGLRSCKDGDWLFQRDNDTIFVWENFDFYGSITPLLTAFANHEREDLFISLMEVLDRHWADDKGTSDECLLSSAPGVPFPTCSKDGLVTYEPLMVQQYVSGILPALHDLSKTLTTLTVPHCDAIDPVTHACTATSLNGITVLANATRQLLDPKLAKTQQLKDRQGKVTSVRNDGTTNPQVTPLYLILEALNGMDASFATYAAAHPSDAGRLTQWRAARSKIVDQFLTITTTNGTPAFANKSVPAILPVVVNTLREQLAENCPASYSPPYPACEWARKTLVTNMQNSMQGPVFSGIMGLVDTMRQNDPGRAQLEALLTYLLTAAQNDALPAVLGSADDMIQVLRDDTNLVPFYHVAAEAARPSVKDGTGAVVQAGAIDASIALLTRLTAKAYAEPAKGAAYEDCGAEIDPNQVLQVALQYLVTPMNDAGTMTAIKGVTPLQVIMDTISDVNRAAPGSGTKLAANDYMSIASNVSDFMSSETSGLEQFYAIIRLGTE